jgi:hypothetical protein
LTIIGRDRRLVLLLGACAVALGGLVYAEIHARPVVESPQTVGPARDESAFALPAARKATSDETGIQAILERPLFSPSRRRPVEQASLETPPPPTPDFALFGVAITAGRPVALVKRGDGTEYERVGEGGQIGDWTVGQIKTDRISIHQDGVDAELRLEFETPAPAASATANLSGTPEEAGSSGEAPEPEAQSQQGQATEPERTGGSEASVEESPGG